MVLKQVKDLLAVGNDIRLQPRDTVGRFKNAKTNQIAKGIIITQTKNGECSWGSGYRTPYILIWSDKSWEPTHLSCWEPLLED